MRLKDNQGIFIEKRMVGNNINDEGNMLGIELDHVAVNAATG